MRYTDKMNDWIHPLMVRWVLRGYAKKLQRRVKSRPELANKVDSEATKKHLDLYSRLGLPCTDKWLRFYSNLTGVVDYTYLPEDLYAARIERVLNNCQRAESEAEDKNLLSKFVDKQYLPQTYLRFIRGLYFDSDYHCISRKEAEGILAHNNGSVIGKVASDSFGGHDVMAFVYEGGHYISREGIVLTCDWIEENTQNYIVQEQIKQCEFAAKFNNNSVNTCRITTLRLPWSGEMIVTKAAMRFGITKSAVDNLSSGGIAVGMSKNGELGSVAFSYKDMKPYTIHPSSRIVFKGLIHPYYEDMCKVVKQQACKFPNFNIMSWDAVADENGNIKILEVNLVTQSTDFEQFAFGSFFGENTEKIIEWVADHLKYDNFKHFKTF